MTPTLLLILLWIIVLANERDHDRTKARLDDQSARMADLEAQEDPWAFSRRTGPPRP